MMYKIRLIQAIAFLSAFLLFQIELIIAKIFLPNFGGSYMVWGACVVFFQAVLMLGYKYAQVVFEKIGLERYRIFHCLLAFLPIISFPGRALPMIFDVPSVSLVLAVFWKLCLLIGPVFFVLSTTSVIWQVWLSSSNLPERKNPYALFAVSNWGSLIALVTYPFFFELHLDLAVQQNLWRIGYVLFAVLQWWAFKLIPVKDARERHVALKPVKPAKVVAWLSYSAAGVMMFLAVTNILTAEIAPVPLLWVVPLVIYLGSFILNFKKKPYCPGWLKDDIHAITGLAVVIFFVAQVPLLPVLLDMILLLLVTYMVCMYTQYQVYRMRPGDHRYLPFFYFMVSLGSFLGGVLVSWIIPVFATTFAEYFAALLVIALTLLFEKKGKVTLAGGLMAATVIILMLIWPLIFSRPEIRYTWIQFSGLGALVLLIPMLFSRMREQQAAFVGCLLVFTLLTPLVEARWSLTTPIHRYRNYYGIGKVREADGVRSFVHGTTIHGAQHLRKDWEHIPLAYYGYRSPVGQVLRSDHYDFKQIGVIGLGIGTVATYFRDGQSIDFFDLDKDVYQVAQDYFTFLPRSKGEKEYYFGDGRLLIKDVPDGKYDLLIIDAFSGDSVPLHLLTREAITIYRRKLTPSGIILMHISNRYIFLGAPVTKTAISLEAATLIQKGKKASAHEQTSLWLAITWDADRLALLREKGNWLKVSPAQEDIPVWTDGHNSVLNYLDYAALLSEFKIIFQ